MKPEIPLRGGDEYDAFSKWCRKYLCCLNNRTGLIKKQQRKYWKRVRANIKKALK